MKHIFKYLTVLLLGSVLVAGCQKADKEVFQRDVDVLSCDCTAQVLKSFVMSSGNWSTESEVDWITLDPASGVADPMYQRINVLVEYNFGAERQGTFYIINGSKRVPVTVTQGECNFKYGAVAFSGALTQDTESTAAVTVAYTGASGMEKANYSGTISGAGAAGLSIEAGSFEGFAPGSGVVTIPIKGTPTAAGAITIDVNIGGKSVGSATANVTEKSVPIIGGEEVTLAVWKFCDHKGTADDKAELITRHAEWWNAELRVGNCGICYSDEGHGTLTVQEAAGKTATAINSWGGGEGHLYIKGFYVGDYWLFTIDQASLKKGDEVSFTGSMGGSGSSAGYFLCEYSLDGSNWTTADGALTETVNSTSFKYHAAPQDNLDGTEQGAFSAKFNLPADVSGKFYIRLIACADVRVNHSSTVTVTTGGGGSTRFKGNITVSAKTAGGSTGGGDGKVQGLPVGWNFYALGMTATDVAASEYNYSWSFGQSNDNDARHPQGAAQPVANHKVLATSGNKEAYITASGANVNKYTFNPSIQISGFGENDYFLMVIPVKNVTSALKVTVEGGVGAAQKATGNWVLEYSSDGSNWITAPDMKTINRADKSWQCHFYNTNNSVSPTRKSYDKATDDTYQKYTFALTGISDIADGNLYFRLRALIWNNSESAPAANTGGWTDLKGFEVSIAE